MTTVQVKLSQNVVDELYSATDGTPSGQGELGDIVDAAIMIADAIDDAYSTYTAWSFANGVLRYTLEEGAYSSYSGVQLANPTALQGSATATTYNFTLPDAVTMNQSGAFKLQYAVTSSPYGDVLAMEVLPGTVLTRFNVATHLPVGSENYDPALGNADITLTGAVRLDPGQILSGTLSRISGTADKFLQSVIEGSFQVSADIDAIAGGSAASTVTGTMNTYQSDFNDGSFVHVTGASIQMAANTVVNASFFADGSHFSGDDTISFDLPGNLYEDFVLAAGAGNDHVTIAGGGGKLHVAAGEGADLISVMSGTHSIDGGAGIDVLALAGPRSSYTVTRTASGFDVRDAAGAINALTSVERVNFGDGVIALDIVGNGGQAYRLYQAAFNRTPDSAGLGFWINALDHGANLNAIAGGFVQSLEYQQAYGSMNSTLELVTKFYENILHRAPEQAGADFWAGVLDRHDATVAEVLAAISESAENQAGLLPVIGNGFPYTPYG